MSLKKGLVLIAGLLILCLPSLAALDLNRIAIVYLQEIATEYYKESIGIQRLIAMQDSFNDEKERNTILLAELRQQRIAAIEAEKQSAVDALSKEISNLQLFMIDRQFQHDIDIQLYMEELMEDSFAAEVLELIENYAINNGYAIVYDMTTETIIWHNESADITSDLLTQMHRNR